MLGFANGYGRSVEVASERVVANARRWWTVLVVGLAHALLCAVVPASAATADPAEGADADSKLPLVPERRVRFEVQEATWLSLDVAPDGQRLVLEILGDLYLLPIEGGTALRITEGLAFDSQPALFAGRAAHRVRQRSQRQRKLVAARPHRFGSSTHSAHQGWRTGGVCPRRLGRRTAIT